MTTAAQIINRATGLIGVRAIGQTLDSTVQSDCFDYFRVMLDTLANEPGLFRDVAIQVPVTSGVNTVTLTDAPFSVEYGWIGADPDPVDVVPQNYFDGLGSSTGQPECMVYDGNGIVTLYPVPDQDYTLILRVKGQSLGFAAITTDVDLVPGMESLLTNNLAVYFASVFEKQPPQMVAIAAAASKREMRRKNATPRAVDCPVTTGKSFDIVRGY